MGGIKVLKLREYARVQRQKRRALKRLTVGNVSTKEWLKLREDYNYTCPSCGKKEPEIDLIMDHIVPLSRGGKHLISNIQPLCRLCNGKKHAKTILFSQKTKGPACLVF